MEFYCLFSEHLRGVGVLNSAIFNSFHNRVEFGTIFEGLRNFGGAGFEPPLGTPLVCPDIVDRGDSLEVWRVAVSVLNKQTWIAQKG